MLGRKIYADYNENLSMRLKEKRALIAVHRGSWGGDIVQNTCLAYELALKMGGDMFEIDLIQSTDGVIYCFHDGNEIRVLGTFDNIKTMSSEQIDAFDPINLVGGRSEQRIERFENVLKRFDRGELYNIDRAWDIFPQVFALLDKYPQARYQALIKAPMNEAALRALSEHPVKYMFMPICRSMRDVYDAYEREDINTVGAELLAETSEDELFQDENIKRIHDMNLFTWANAITLGSVRTRALYALLDDNISLKVHPDAGWGKLLKKRIDVLQTDWPSLLYQYREQYFAHSDKSGNT